MSKMLQGISGFFRLVFVFCLFCLCCFQIVNV